MWPGEEPGPHVLHLGGLPFQPGADLPGGVDHRNPGGDQRLYYSHRMLSLTFGYPSCAASHVTVNAFLPVTLPSAQALVMKPGRRCSHAVYSTFMCCTQRPDSCSPATCGKPGRGLLHLCTQAFEIANTCK